MLEVIHNYRNNDALRHSFNALAEQTFGLNFENWYQNGFWGDAYDPYSIVIDGEVVANVSLNRTDMIIGGERKKIYQLGTVMTKVEYRNRGLIRQIMAKIDEAVADADGVYLFANDEVLGFYPKFGFTKGEETVFSKEIGQTKPCTMKHMAMDGPENFQIFRMAMELGEPFSGCAMTDNPGLFFFYVSQFMPDCVYFCPELNAWAIAEIEDGELLLHNVFAPAGVMLEAVIDAFGSAVKKVILGFAPADQTGWEKAPLHEENTTFFVRGDVFEEFTEPCLRIPTLSHA